MFVSRIFAPELSLAGTGYAAGNGVRTPVIDSVSTTGSSSYMGGDLRATVSLYQPSVSPRYQEALSVEGTPLIDLKIMSREQVQRLLFQRSAVALAARNNLTYFRGSGIPDSHVRDAAFMAAMEGTPIQFFLRRNGWPEWGVRSATQRVLKNDWTFSYLDFRHNVRDSLKGLSRDRQEMFLAVYMELAFHTRLQVAQNLTVAGCLMDYLNLSWKDALALRSALSSSFEKELIRTVERQGGCVPFDLYFQYAMFDSGYGVYSSETGNGLIGATGFFSTCSEMPAYGRVLARSVCELWLSLGRPAAFDVVEMGGGNGTLARNILSEVDALSARHPVMAGLKAALRYHLVEMSPALARKQRETLAPYGSRAVVHEGSVLSLNELPEIENGVFLSNELVDMFPPTRVVESFGSVFETWVSSAGGFLQQTLRPLSTATSRFLNDYRIGFDGVSSYWMHQDLGDWMGNIRRRLKRGYVLTVDYGGRRLEMLFGRGDGAFRMLRGYRSRESLKELLGINFPDALAAEYNNEPTGMFFPKDLTTDVDFTALADAAEKAGFAATRLMLQRDFLSGVLEHSPVPEEPVNVSSLQRFGEFHVLISKTG